MPGSGPPDQLVRHSFDFTFNAGKKLTDGGIATRVHRYFIQLFPLAFAFDDQLFIVNHREVSTNPHGPSNRFAGLGQAQVLWMRTHRDDTDQSQSGLDGEVASAISSGDFTPTIRPGAVLGNADSFSCWVVESHR